MNIRNLPMPANAQLKSGRCTPGPVFAYRRAKPPVSRCDMACFSRQHGLFQNARQNVLQLTERQMIIKNGPNGCP